MVDMSFNDFKSQVRAAAAVRVKRYNGIWLARLNLGKLSDLESLKILPMVKCLYFYLLGWIAIVKMPEWVYCVSAFCCPSSYSSFDKCALFLDLPAVFTQSLGINEGRWASVNTMEFIFYWIYE